MQIPAAAEGMFPLECTALISTLHKRIPLSFQVYIGTQAGANHEDSVAARRR